jgi:hypothetical protein
MGVRKYDLEGRISKVKVGRWEFESESSENESSKVGVRR